MRQLLFTFITCFAPGVWYRSAFQGADPELSSFSLLFVLYCFTVIFCSKYFHTKLVAGRQRVMCPIKMAEPEIIILSAFIIRHA